MKLKDAGLFQKYKQYRNKVNNFIKKSKKNYYVNYFTKFESNMARN